MHRQCKWLGGRQRHLVAQDQLVHLGRNEWNGLSTLSKGKQAARVKTGETDPQQRTGLWKLYLMSTEKVWKHSTSFSVPRSNDTWHLICSLLVVLPGTQLHLVYNWVMTISIDVYGCKRPWYEAGPQQALSPSPSKPTATSHTFLLATGGVMKPESLASTTVTGNCLKTTKLLTWKKIMDGNEWITWMGKWITNYLTK